MSTHITENISSFDFQVFIHSYLGIASIRGSDPLVVSVRPTRIPKVRLHLMPQTCPLLEFGLSSSLVARLTNASAAVVGNPL